MGMYILLHTLLCHQTYLFLSIVEIYKEADSYIADDSEIAHGDIFSELSLPYHLYKNSLIQGKAGWTNDIACESLSIRLQVFLQKKQSSITASDMVNNACHRRIKITIHRTRTCV